ncbi:M24 family metallopeptidase [Pararhodobacter sp.]|uniref:M24 family metallopeptidase n=1 Tax=Pararhodobacter sp. TaxID=2127056 RepID=UPI002AFDD32F|nr:M24 family metallopeptidase [Pararhodobacter sp.]
MPDTNSPISDKELERRWTIARQIMADHGLDALVMQAREDWIGGYVRWFTDVPANNGYPRTVVFFADRPMVVIEMGAFGTDRRPQAGNKSTRGVGQVLGTPSFHSIHYTIRYDTELLLGCLQGCKRVGALAPAAMPYSMTAALMTQFDLFDVTEALDAAKAIKSPEEIALIHQCAALQDQVFAEVCDFIRPGVSDRDITSFAEAVGRRLGSDQGIHLGLSAPMGSASRFAPRHFQTRELRAGDHMSLLIEVSGPGGLYLEIARTMVLGTADDHLLGAFEQVKAAQDHTLSLMHPGAAPAQISAAHDAWMRARGLPPETRLYAHGQGYEMVERPLIRHDETMPLAEGMCLAVHPGFDDGRVFAVICDNYMIEAEGPSACLHRTEKKIFEL